MIRIVIGNKVKEIRLANKMSTRKLAEIISISQPYLVMLENGTRDFDVKVLFDISEAFKVSPIVFIEAAQLACSLANKDDGKV